MSKRESTPACVPQVTRLTQVVFDPTRSARLTRVAPGRLGGALVLGALVAATVACSGRECTSGTVAVGDECRPAQAQVQCGPGFKIVGLECRPDDDWVKHYCDETTTEFKDGKCVGTGGVPSVCPNRCPAASGNTICVAGRAFEFTSLLTKGEAGATAVKPDSEVEVVLYDPFAFVADPNGPPLATAQIEDANGCFTVPQVQLPAVLPFFAGGLRPKAAATATPLVLAAMAIFAEANKNVTAAQVLAVSKATTDAWGVADLLSAGSLALWYRSTASGAGIAGVVPNNGGAALPAVRYLKADGSGVDAAATATTPAGIAIATPAVLGSYGGSKAGCAFTARSAASSAPALFFMPIDGEGC